MHNYDPLIVTKSLNERLEYLSSVLDNSLKAVDVKAVWSSYIELLNFHKLQAIWKVPREFCQDHNQCFPCTVVVCVSTPNEWSGENGLSI